MLIGALDIGGTKIAAGVVDDEGRILAQAACPTEPETGFVNGIKRIEQLLRGCLAAVAGQRLDGIGIGCTGPVDPVSGILGPNNFLVGWEGENLPGAIAERFGVPAVVENDADAAALGEAAWGAGRGAKRFIYITVSTGIGGGLVLDGQVYRGVDGAHPEMGHQVIETGGPVCQCGAQGCWEALASGPGLAAWFNAQRQDQAGAALPPVDAREICRLAEQGHALALRAGSAKAITWGLGWPIWCRCSPQM